MENINKQNNKKINSKKSNNLKNQNLKKIETNKINNEEDKLNIIEYNNSELKTKKKEFINKIDPHNLKRLIQKERYIWFGVHNELLRNKNMIKLIEKCKDKTLPIESAAIHLDKYRIGFNKNRVFIKNDANNVIFFKLYLIKKDDKKEEKEEKEEKKEKKDENKFYQELKDNEEIEKVFGKIKEIKKLNMDPNISLEERRNNAEKAVMMLVNMLNLEDEDDIDEEEEK